MNMATLTSSVELGLLYTLLTLGLFISYRILDIADLTVDGSFTLGAAVCAVVTVAGHPFLAFAAAIGAGLLAGTTTAILQTKLKVQPILAGILTMTALYSINLMIMGGKSNLSLLKIETAFTKLEGLTGAQYNSLMIGLFVVVIVCVLLALFLYTTLGLSIRATGDNEDMVKASSINVDFTKTVGLALANALVAASGALIAQHQGFADANSGTGMVVIGLASLIIGEIVVDLFFKKRSIPLNILAAVIGTVIYRIVIALALAHNFSASSMKLVTAIIVTVVISFPTSKDGIKLLCKRAKYGTGTK